MERTAAVVKGIGCAVLLWLLAAGCTSTQRLPETWSSGATRLHSAQMALETDLPEELHEHVPATGALTSAELHASLDVPRTWRMRLTSLAWTAINVGTGTYDTTVPAKVHRLAAELEVGAGGTVVRLHGTRYGLRRVLPQIRRLEGGASTPTRA